MAYRVIYTERFAREIEDLVRKSEDWFNDELNRKIQQIPENPLIGESFRRGFRRRLIGNLYYLYWKTYPRTQTIKFFTIWHCKRLAPRLDIRSPEG